MSESIEAALTAEEWAKLLGPAKRGHHHYVNSGTELEVVRDCDLCLGQFPPHARAALCLYGTPQGFTQEDVEALGSLIVVRAMPWEPGEFEAILGRVSSIASRISALLPPSPSTETTR